MPVEARDWSNPFSWLDKMLFKCQEAEKSGLNAAYSRFKAKLHHLSLIWDRLEGETATHEGLGDLMFKGAKEGTFTDVDEISRQMILNQGFLILDLKDFVLHSRILMDRAGVLIAHLIKGPARNLRCTSFNKHRRFFLDPQNVPYDPDEDYACYVRKQMGWFVMLRTARDYQIVHDISLHGTGLMAGPRMAPRRMQSIIPSWGVKQQQDYERLRLRDKYSKTLGESLSKEDNVWELLDLFETYANKLEADDLKAVTEIKRKLGGKLPDVNVLSTHILEFINCGGDHFRKRCSEWLEPSS
jgi:hypothetical protein